MDMFILRSAYGVPVDLVELRFAFSQALRLNQLVLLWDLWELPVLRLGLCGVLLDDANLLTGQLIAGGIKLGWLAIWTLNLTFSNDICWSGRRRLLLGELCCSILVKRIDHWLLLLTIQLHKGKLFVLTDTTLIEALQVIDVVDDVRLWCHLLHSEWAAI